MIDKIDHDRGMTLEQLKIFCAVVEHGGFRTAAEALFRSQSSVSTAIRNLEESLAIELFQRDNYRPELTPNGQAIYRSACRLLTQAAALKKQAGQLTQGDEPEIRLAVSGLVNMEPLLQELNRLRRDAPATDVSLQVENLAGTIERLHDDEADMAISDVYDDPGQFESIEMTRVLMPVVVHPDERAARQPEQATLADLDNPILIVVKDTSRHSTPLSRGAPVNSPTWQVNDFMMKRCMIMAGNGWGRLPMHLIAQDIAQQRLVPLNSAEFPMLEIPLYLVRKRHRTIGPVEQLLWQRLQSAWPNPENS